MDVLADAETGHVEPVVERPRLEAHFFACCWHGWDDILMDTVVVLARPAQVTILMQFQNFMVFLRLPIVRPHQVAGEMINLN